MHLEDHVHRRVHGDDLTVHQAQFLVVVEHGVHVFDPDGVHRPVEHHPFTIGGGVHGEFAVFFGKDAILPLVRHRVELTVELPHVDGLGVDDNNLHLVLLQQALRVEVLQRGGEHAIHARLGAVRVPHEHQAVSHEDHLVQLENLLEKHRRGLQVRLVARLRQRRAHVIIIRLGQLHPREEIREDVVEQRHVRRQELGEVHVLERDEHEHGFVLVRELELDRPRRSQHRDDGAHAVIIVALRRKLLRAQFVRRHELDGERSRLKVPARVQENLGDEGVVWNHHRHGSEERLEVIRQLGATGVARVHGDEHVARASKGKARSLEIEHRRLGRLGSGDCENLLRDDGEHLEVDAVELVEARPRARRREALKKLSHREVIQTVGAVEDDALHGDRLGEILGGLRLSRARGTLRSAANVQVHRTHQRAIASIRQRGDHQPRRVAEVLIPIRDGGVDHTHRDAALSVFVFVPRVAELTGPLEIVHIGHRFFRQIVHHVPRVHLDHHQRRQRLSLQFRKLASNLLDDVHQLRAAHLCVLGHGTVRDGGFGLRGPIQRPDAENYLTGPRHHPVRALGGGVGVRGLLTHHRHRLSLRRLALDEPLLHRAAGFRRIEALLELHLLSLLGDHRGHLQIFLELQEVDGLEHLLQVGLHAQRILRLGENLQQLVVGQKVKPRERQSLGLEVVAQALVHLVQQLVALLQRPEQLFVGSHGEHLGGELQLRHRLSPRRVHRPELAALRRHLLHDVVRPEDGFQVEPTALHLQPLVQNLLNGGQFLLPQLDAILERADVRRRAHRLRLDDLVVEQHLRLLRPLEDARPRVAPGCRLERHALPVDQHLVQGAFQGELLAGEVGVPLDGLDVLRQLQL